MMPVFSVIHFLLLLLLISGTNWGLPLAIAANLHVPYRIELNHSYVSQIEDKLGAGKSFNFSTSFSPGLIILIPMFA